MVTSDQIASVLIGLSVPATAVVTWLLNRRTKDREATNNERNSFASAASSVADASHDIMSTVKDMLTPLREELASHKAELEEHKAALSANQLKLEEHKAALAENRKALAQVNDVVNLFVAYVQKLRNQVFGLGHDPVPPPKELNHLVEPKEEPNGT